MNKIKTQRILQTLNDRALEIFNEIESSVAGTLQWANELEAIIGKELSTCKNEELLFRLPKTPCENKHRNRKTKRTLVSTSTVVNSTFTNDTSSLDCTISTRTRSRRRVLPSTTTNNFKEDGLLKVKTESTITEISKASIPDETFVLPVSHSTRTKPVVRNKQEEDPVEVCTADEDNNETLKITDANPDNSLGKKKASRVPSRSPAERESRRKVSRTISDSASKKQSPSIFSRTFSESPVSESSKSNGNRATLSDRNVADASESVPLDRPPKRKVSRALSESPIKKPSKISKTFCTSEADESINTHRQGLSTANKTSNLSLNVSLSPSPVKPNIRVGTFSGQINSVRLRSSSIKPLITSQQPVKNPAMELNSLVTLALKAPEECQSFYNKTATIGSYSSPNTAKTFLIDETDHKNGLPDGVEESTPKISGSKFRLSKTSTPVGDREKTLLFDEEISQSVFVEGEKTITVFENDTKHSPLTSTQCESNKISDVSKKKRTKKTKKTSKKSVSKEKAEEMDVRITRTKSKAMKEKVQEAAVDAKQQEDLSVLAKKLLSKAKNNYHMKHHLAALKEHNGTPRHISGTKMDGLNVGYPSACHLLMSGAKRPITPLATHPNSTMKKAQSCDKNRVKLMTKGDGSVEKIRSATKAKYLAEGENKLTTMKNKEDEAAVKRQKVIQSKQEELKRKNELKHQLALKQREKLEQEKYLNMIQSEKEKEERHKLILHERQMKQKEETYRKKMMKQQKIAETAERRRIEEEARLAKLKEMEAEEQRLALERQKEQERLEKWEQERLALKKVKEEYELQMKQELEAERLRAEKAASTKKFLASANKLQSASKKPMFGLFNGDKKDWDYKPRSEHDYGLDGENSEIDSDDEKPTNNSRPVPVWAKKVMNRAAPMLHTITLEMLCEYLPCGHKTPDINKMFNMTPTKRIKRTSSAIWNTPTS